MSYGVVTVGTAATLIVAENPNRIEINIQNTGTYNLWLGQDANVTTATGGIVLGENASYSTESSEAGKCWLGNFYAVTNTANVTANYWEVGL